MHTNNKFFTAVLIVMLALILKPYEAAAADYIMYMISGKEGVMRSKNGGRSWSGFTSGLPKGSEPMKLYSFGGKSGLRLYLATMESGLYKLNGSKWIPLNNSLFKTGRLYKAEGKFRKISAFTEDAVNPDRIFAATKHSVYESPDGGQTWKPLELKGVHPRNYITALAVRGDKFAAGTSFNGVFVKSGGVFSARVKGLPREQYEPEKYFTEEISSLAWAPGTAALLCGTNFGGGAYISTDEGRAWKRIDTPGAAADLSRAADVKFHGEDGWASAGSSVYKINPDGRTENFSMDKYFAKIDADLYPESVLAVEEGGQYPPLAYAFNKFKTDKKNKIADRKKAVYVSMKMLRNTNYVLKVVRSTGFNSVVIDMKDDAGYIFFEASEKTAREIGAQRAKKWIPDALKILKENNIYLIARMVVFKDMKLFRGYNSAYSIKTKGSGAPWRGVEDEYWVDPHSEFVHGYNISLAKDAEAMGFDEIQFDYIRFPSDGGVHRCEYQYKKSFGSAREPVKRGDGIDPYKSEPVADFLYKAKDALKVPVSVDLYGFNTWYMSGNWIGQDIEEFSRIVDAICPMVYPSHFGSRFYTRFNYKERPFHIVYNGGVRSIQLVKNRTVIRPYLQAFRLLSPGWGPDYIRGQARGAEESGCGGFIWWNAKGEYDIVIQSFSGK